MKKKLFHNC